MSDTEVRNDLAYLKGVVGCQTKVFLYEDLRESREDESMDMYTYGMQGHKNGRRRCGCSPYPRPSDSSIIVHTPAPRAFVDNVPKV